MGNVIGLREVFFFLYLGEKDWELDILVRWSGAFLIDV